MPTITLTASPENAAKIVAALELMRARDVGQSDVDLVKSRIIKWLTEIVLAYDKIQASTNVQTIDDIVD